MTEYLWRRNKTGWRKHPFLPVFNRDSWVRGVLKRTSGSFDPNWEQTPELAGTSRKQNSSRYYSGSE